MTEAPDERRSAGPEEGAHRVFVIQKHDAKTLHYDLRLEVAGVLKSWAVPKGPPADPAEKRLAIPTGDHPLEYAGFEGVIPAGEYGAGTVMVWDTGTYENIRAGKDGVSMEESLREGKLEVRLAGSRLKGDYALIRTGRREPARWLFFRMHGAGETDAHPAEEEDRSVLTGRSMDEIAGSTV
jgi:bifunctional non-homologous end joining protein LigD